MKTNTSTTATEMEAHTSKKVTNHSWTESEAMELQEIINLCAERGLNGEPLFYAAEVLLQQKGITCIRDAIRHQCSRTVHKNSDTNDRQKQKAEKMASCVQKSWADQRKKTKSITAASAKAKNSPHETEEAISVRRPQRSSSRRARTWSPEQMETRVVLSDEALATVE